MTAPSPIKLAAILGIALSLTSAAPAQDAQDLGVTGVRAPKIELRHDADGWTLLSDNKPLYVKGVNWSYTPVGQKYDFNRWTLPTTSSSASSTRTPP